MKRETAVPACYLRRQCPGYVDNLLHPYRAKIGQPSGIPTGLWRQQYSLVLLVLTLNRTAYGGSKQQPAAWLTAQLRPSLLKKCGGQVAHFSTGSSFSDTFSSCWPCLQGSSLYASDSSAGGSAAAFSVACSADNSCDRAGRWAWCASCCCCASSGSCGSTSRHA